MRKLLVSSIACVVACSASGPVWGPIGENAAAESASGGGTGLMVHPIRGRGLTLGQDDVYGSLAGTVTAVSIFVDGSGGIGTLNTECDTSGNCVQVPVTLAAHGDSAHSFALTIPSSTRSWRGELRFGWTCTSTDCEFRGHRVQLVELTGQDTLATNDGWVAMTATDSRFCIADTDCTMYGLDETTGAYACVTGVCQQRPAR